MRFSASRASKRIEHLTKPLTDLGGASLSIGRGHLVLRLCRSLYDDRPLSLQASRSSPTSFFSSAHSVFQTGQLVLQFADILIDISNSFGHLPLQGRCRSAAQSSRPLAQQSRRAASSIAAGVAFWLIKRRERTPYQADSPLCRVTDAPGYSGLTA